MAASTNTHEIFARSIPRSTSGELVETLAWISVKLGLIGFSSNLLEMEAPFLLRKRDKSDPVRRAGPALQVRKGRNCEVVCATGLRFPANIKLGNPENSGRTFDLQAAVPLGELLSQSAV